MPALNFASGLMPDTRISAHTRPSKVDSSSDPKVTSMVRVAPCSNIGRNSRASLKNSIIIQSILSGYTETAGGPGRRQAPLRRSIRQVPFLEDGVNGAVGLELAQRLVDARQQLGVFLAGGDAQAAHHRGLVALGHFQVGIAALGNDAGRDRVVHEAALDAAGV